jgi:hypothetical protein
MSNLSTVRSNARVFTRLLGLDVDPHQFKYSSGEDDAYNALDCAAILLKETERFIGKHKHPGQPFDFVGDVKADMAEMLLIDADATKQAVKRKRHLPLFYLIVEPALESLRTHTHQEAVNQADELFDTIKATLFTDDNYGTYDDAIVANAQVRRMIRMYDEQTRLAASARKKKSRQAARELEEDLTSDATPDVE